MVSVKGIPFLLTLLMIVCGCGGVDEKHESVALVTKTLVLEQREPLGILANNVRARFLAKDGYQLKYSKDHGYQGEYLEFSRGGKVVLEAMKLPFEEKDYVVSMYESDFMSEKDKADLCLIISESFSEEVCAKEDGQDRDTHK